MLSFSDRYVGLATLASFILGYQMAVLNTSLVFFTLQFETCGDTYTYRCEESKRWESLASTMVFIGATFGSIIGVATQAARGRRFTLLISHCVSIAGASVCFFSYNFQMLLLGLFVNGLCVGVVSVAAPSMITEMCPAETRGSRRACHQLAVTVGITAAVALGLFMTQPPLYPDSSYIVPDFERRWIRLMQAFPGMLSALTLILMVAIFKDDTPQALLQRGRTTSATKVLLKIYGDPIEAEERLLELNEAMNEPDNTSFFSIIKTPEYLKVLIVGCILSIGQQAGGINAFVARSTRIFQDSGISTSLTAKLSSLMAVINVLMTFSVACLITSLRRKSFLLMGLCGQGVFLSIVPIAAVTGRCLPCAASVSIIGFILFFAIAYGHVLWVYLFEIYPPNLKGPATGLASALNWITGSLVVYLNGTFSEEYTTANFAVFAGSCWIFFIFVAVFVEESEGSTESSFISSSESEPLGV